MAQNLDAVFYERRGGWSPELESALQAAAYGGAFMPYGLQIREN